MTRPHEETGHVGANKKITARSKAQAPADGFQFNDSLDGARGARARQMLQLAALAFVNARHAIDADQEVSRASFALLAQAARAYYEVMTLREAVLIEVRAAQIAAQMIHELRHDMTVEELVGWMSCGDPRRAERGDYPKSPAWQAGWLAAIIWSHERGRGRHRTSAMAHRRQVKAQVRERIAELRAARSPK